MYNELQRALCGLLWWERTYHEDGLARAFFEYVGFGALDRRFYLFDTFAGIPDEAISEEERRLGRRAGGYDECYDAVRILTLPTGQGLMPAV